MASACAHWRTFRGAADSRNRRLFARRNGQWGISWEEGLRWGKRRERSHRPVSRDRRRGEIGSAIHLLWVQRRDRTDAQTATALWKRYVISLSYLARPLAFPFDERRVPIDKRLDRKSTRLNSSH